MRQISTAKEEFSAMQPAEQVLDHLSGSLSLREKRTTIVEAAFINIVIIATVFLGHRLHTLAEVVVGLLVVGLCVGALVHPIRTFFLLVGVKLTFDALWFLDLPLSTTLSRPLVVILVPIVILILLGPPVPLGRPMRITLCAVLYLLWVVCAQAFGQRGLDVEITTRQAGILIGLVLGLKYVRSQDDLDFLCVLVALSTVLPVFMGLFQLAYPGADVFYARTDLFREYRPSGIYHDAGTSGTVYLMALASSSYLLLTPGTPRRLRQYAGLLILCSIVLIVAGGTLSMLAATCCGLLVLWLRAVGRLRSPLLPIALLALLFVGAYLLAQTPFLDAIRSKAAGEFERMQEGAGEGRLFGDSQLFTGRMGLWQTTWAEFEAGGPMRQLLGAGLCGSHSTYVHLLVQIGVAGLLFYLMLNGWIVFQLARVRDRHFGATLAIVSVAWMLLIGISLTTVHFTSFQWCAYMLVGGVLRIRHDDILTQGHQMAYSPLCPPPLSSGNWRSRAANESTVG